MKYYTEVFHGNGPDIFWRLRQEMERAVDFKWLWNTLEDHRMKYSTETTSHHIENTAQQASRFNKTYDIHSVGSGHGTTEYKGRPKRELNEKDMWWMTVPNKFTKNSCKEQTSSIPFVIERNYCNVVACTAPDRVSNMDSLDWPDLHVICGHAWRCKRNSGIGDKVIKDAFVNSIH